MHSRKILVVDDEVGVADLCRHTLGTLGHTVYCTHCGEYAVELSEKINFDVVVINAMLSGLDGIETFTMIREQHPNLVGILITGHTELQRVIDAMSKGFSGVLEKPLDSRKLVTAVNDAMALAYLREENTRLQTLMPLYLLGNRFIAAISAEDVYAELIQVIVQEINVPSISIMMYEQETGYLKIVASRGLRDDIVKRIRLKPGEKIAGWVFEKGKPVILNRETQHESQFAQLLKRHEISAAISFPLVNNGRAIGVVNISQTNISVTYSQADIEMLSIVCGQAVMALANVAYIAERERTARLKAMFQQFVSPEIAKILIEKDQNLLDVGEVRVLTVLFADIRNFTILVQHIPPEELRIFLNQFFDLFADIVFSCQGTLDKFMGDAALVIFGAPVEIDNPSLSAVTAACRIAVEFEVLRLSWAAKSSWFADVGIGIGVTRGKMFLGNVGSSRRLDYTVIGTDVNVAQRLASCTQPGQVLITENVKEEVAAYFQVREENPRLLRGLEKIIPLYSIFPG
jgi:adenylate cyclase